jgi:hypothetical protein
VLQRRALELALLLAPLILRELALGVDAAHAAPAQIATRVEVGRGRAGARGAEERAEPALAAGDAEEEVARDLVERGEARAGGVARGEERRAAREGLLAGGNALGRLEPARERGDGDALAERRGVLEREAPRGAVEDAHENLRHHRGGRRRAGKARAANGETRRGAARGEFRPSTRMPRGERPE